VQLFTATANGILIFLKKIREIQVQSGTETPSCHQWIKLL